VVVAVTKRRKRKATEDVGVEEDGEQGESGQREHEKGGANKNRRISCPIGGCTLDFSSKINVVQHMRDAVKKEAAAILAGDKPKFSHPPELVKSWIDGNVKEKYVGKEKQKGLMHFARMEDVALHMMNYFQNPYP
jgi:hypothetical protein